MFKVFLVKDELSGQYTAPRLVSQHRSLTRALRVARSYKGRATVVDSESYTYIYSIGKGGSRKHIFMDAAGETKEII